MKKDEQFRDSNGMINPITINDKIPGKEDGKKKLIEPIRIIKKEDEKSPEEKQYLVWYIYQESEVEYRSFELIIGRSKAYEFLRNFIIDAEYLDIYESKILVEGCKLEEALTIVEFMKLMEGYFNDGFDIRNYYDIDEEGDVKENGET